MNKITVFSNGIADFIRNFKIEKGKTQKISLAVKKDHVGDVLASFNLFGNVKLIAPPTFPTDAEGILALDAEDALHDIGNKLSGAKVEIALRNQAKYTGTLIGNDSQTDIDGRILSKSIVILTDKGIRRFPLNDTVDGVNTISFTDEAIQKEVDRALSHNLQKIKPNSTVVELEVGNESKEDAEAWIQYSVPAAAWKISYRLNAIGPKVELKGLAVVDNNTEENWDNVLVSVVTGEPITFSTDIAEAKLPRRSHVNIVKDTAIGSVELEPMVMACAAGGSSRSMRRKGFPVDDVNSLQQYASGEVNLDEDYYVPVRSAMASQAETKEQGDFCIFTAKNPVTIAAHTSAVIPVFDADLSEAKVVLHFKTSNHNTRAFRAIEFKNETDHSLERGVCTVNLDGIYSGSCIVPALKSGEKQLLPHALETGVKVQVQSRSNDTKLGRMFSKNGSWITEQINKIETPYKIQNVKNESFKFYLEHQMVDPKHSLTVNLTRKESAPLTGVLNGANYLAEFDLKEKESVEVVVTETIVTSSALEIHFNNYDYIFRAYIENNESLLKVKGVDKLIALCEAVEAVKAETAKVTAETQKLTNRQTRLQNNIGKGGPASEIVINWQQELAKCEDRITQIEEEVLPGLEKKEETAINKVVKAMQEISFDLNL
jgi:hypothetical protein